MQWACARGVGDSHAGGGGGEGIGAGRSAVGAQSQHVAQWWPAPTTRFVHWCVGRSSGVHHQRRRLDRAHVEPGRQAGVRGPGELAGEAHCPTTPPRVKRPQGAGTRARTHTPPSVALHVAPALDRTSPRRPRSHVALHRSAPRAAAAAAQVFRARSERNTKISVGCVRTDLRAKILVGGCEDGSLQFWRIGSTPARPDKVIRAAHTAAVTRVEISGECGVVHGATWRAAHCACDGRRRRWLCVQPRCRRRRCCHCCRCCRSRCGWWWR